MTEAKLSDATAQWRAFCNALEETGCEILESAQGADPVSQAEGLRYLTRLLRSGIEKFVEHSDPRDPFLANVYNERLKWGLDNPDSLYAMAYVDGTKEYEITGNVGTVPYFNFTSAIMSTTAHYDITGVLDSVDVKADANGDFKVWLGGPERSENWVRLDPASNSMMVRQTFADRSREREMSFKIAIASEPASAVPVTMTDAIARTGQAQAFFANTGRTFVKLAATLRESRNALPLVDQALMLSMGGDPNYAYFWGSFDLADGEALLVHWPEVPDAQNWNLCLYNYWLESLDYTKGQISVNKDQAILNDDGSLTIVVSDQRPKAGNWLQTLGHGSGTMMSRWINTSKVVTPRTQLVRLDEVDWSARTKIWL